MHDDNPLWYDHVEPGEDPGPVLSALAAAFAGLAMATAALRQIYLLPDRLWITAFGKGR